jgi:hypothetical protein
MRTSFVILSVLSSKLPCTPALHIDSFQPAELTRECPENGITMYGMMDRDGFGSTYAAMLGVYMYAALQNRTYCTTQWTHTSHGVRMDEMFQWVGGSEFGPPATSQTERAAWCVDWTESDHYTHERQQLFNEAREHIRDYYFERTKGDGEVGKRLLAYSKSAHESLNLLGEGDGRSETVAWHIRRGDVGPQSHTLWYLSNADISKALIGLHKAYSVHVVHFISEGVKNDFQTVIDTCTALDIECVWHLNSPIPAAHYSLSIADILVVARSTFSGTASFLSQGKVFTATQLIPSETGRINIKPLSIQAIWELVVSDLQTEKSHSERIKCKRWNSTERFYG